MNRYTHGHHESVLRSHRWRTVENSAAYLAPLIRPGTQLLDVGCGPGTITRDFARLVGDDGHVTGIDAAPGITDTARTEAAALGLSNISFAVGDAYAIDAPDDSFDVVHAHQVLQHLADPVAALRELRRVARPDGVVAARDADYRAMTWYPQSQELSEWMNLYQAVARSNGGEPDAGRHLLAWSQQAGFADIDSSASVWCFATPEDRLWWGGLWADRLVDSAFAQQATERGLATPDRLQAISTAWRAWAEHDDAWFAVLHGEILCRG